MRPAAVATNRDADEQEHGAASSHHYVPTPECIAAVRRWQRLVHRLGGCGELALGELLVAASLCAPRLPSPPSLNPDQGVGLLERHRV